MKKVAQDKVIFGTLRYVAGSVLATAVMLTALMGLTGCSNNTQTATQALETTLSAIQDQDAATAEEYLQAVWFDPTLYSVSNETFVATYFDDFSSEIQGAEENSDGTVTVTVNLSSKNMAQVLDDLYTATEAAYADPESLESIQDADPFFLELYEAHTWDVSENTYYIVMAQAAGGSWQIAEPATFGAMLLNGYDPRQIMSDD